MAKALLLTGAPGVGKTTVVRRLAGLLAGRDVGGFLTEEMRVRGARVGFSVEDLRGGRAVLAHVDFTSPHRVGRYGVDVAALDRVVTQALGTAEVFLVDEIGKMECFSPRFVAAVEALLDADRPLVATVAARGGGFIARVKARPDVELWQVTRENRDALPARIAARLEGPS